jgi:hypothetical protein
MRRMMIALAGVLAHVSPPGYATLIAMGLFFVGMVTAIGAYWCSGQRRASLRRGAATGLGILAFGCLGLATATPFIIHPGPSFIRPSSTARLEIVSPRPDGAIRGDPATVVIELRLIGGTIVPTTSTDVEPNRGHIHVFLDDRLLSMTGLHSTILAVPGTHTLRAEFVASDHGPFRPPVTASVTFRVRG